MRCCKYSCGCVALVDDGCSKEVLLFNCQSYEYTVHLQERELVKSYTMLGLEDPFFGEFVACMDRALGNAHAAKQIKVALSRVRDA